MARLMSVSLTEDAVRARLKTVTRRAGWEYLEPGDRLQLCRKVMGRRKGDPLVRICVVQVVSVRRERLADVDCEEVIREGLAGMTPAEFVEFFCATHRGVTPDTVVTRIQWAYLDGQGHPQRPPVVGQVCARCVECRGQARSVNARPAVILHLPGCTERAAVG